MKILRPKLPKDSIYGHISLILRGNKKILQIISESIRNENLEVLKSESNPEQNPSYLVHEIHKSDSLIYEIGNSNISTLINTVNDLLTHISLVERVSKRMEIFNDKS